MRDRETGYRDDQADDPGHKHRCMLCGREFDCHDRDCGKLGVVNPEVCGKCEYDLENRYDDRALLRELERQAGCEDWPGGEDE